MYLEVCASTSIYICNHSRIIWTSLSLFFCCFFSFLEWLFSLVSYSPFLLRFWLLHVVPWLHSPLWSPPHSPAATYGILKHLILGPLSSRVELVVVWALGRVFVVCTKLQIWLYMLLLAIPPPETHPLLFRFQPHKFVNQDPSLQSSGFSAPDSVHIFRLLLCGRVVDWGEFEACRNNINVTS